MTDTPPTVDPNSSERICIDIGKDVDIIWVRQRITALATEIGFSIQKIWELSIALSELGTNIIKYAGDGTICFQPTPNRPGIQIIAEDKGPGIENIENAMQDGFSQGRLVTEEPIDKRSGLGAGLGAVKRLMDELTIENKPKGGLKVTACKYLS